MSRVYRSVKKFATGPAGIEREIGREERVPYRAGLGAAAAVYASSDESYRF